MKLNWINKVLLSRISVIFPLLAVCATLNVFAQKQQVMTGIQRYLDSQSHEKSFSGEVLIATEDDKPLKKSFPDASNDGNNESERDRNFPAESITEQFLAAAILQLESSGQIHLEDPICGHLPNCPREWSDIRVFQLLSHSSGLPELPDFPPCLAKPTSSFDSSSIILSLSHSPLLFKPGTRFNANKLDYYFAALLIEKLSGQSTGGYLRQHIFLPLKLAHTGYSTHRSQILNSPDPAHSETCPQGQSALAPPYFANEMFTTVGDLYLWNKALMSGQFLSKPLVEKMFTPYIEGHGFGGKVVKEFDRMVFVQNDKFGPASISSRIYPDDLTCILVVSHTESAPATSISHDLGAILFSKNLPATMNSVAPPSQTPH